MSGSNGAGKGDRYRKVDPEKYAENWEKAFGKKKTKKKFPVKRQRGKQKQTPVTQWIEYRISNPAVAGSSPARRVYYDRKKDYKTY